MIQKFYSFLYTLDIIGAMPQLFIFNSKRYKSIFSSITSLLIILFSIGFGIISLYEYLKYESPNIAFSKDNDEKTERSILLKDLILAFQLVDSIDNFYFNTLNDSIGYFQADFNIYYNNGSMDYKLLDIENCEFGKNIDLKYKDLFNNKSTYGRSIEEFYCLNTQNTNLSLFYNPKVGFSFVTLYIIFKNNTLYSPEQIQSFIISENNFINHINKNNPINKGYIFQFTGAYNSLEFTKTHYVFQYIEYESDEGFFYKKSKSFKGISFSDMISYRNNGERYGLNKNNSIIGAIGFLINQSNFDSYKRTYQRLQSLLAEVMSVVNILLEIGRQISYIVCNKKMSKDIIEMLLNNNKRSSVQTSKINNNLLKNNGKKDIISERKEIIDGTNAIININNNEKNDEIKLNKSNENTKIKNVRRIKKVNNKIMKKINYWHILKSFLCFKDKKTKLINLCHSIITEDMCIERILERFYNLESIYKNFSKKEKEKFKYIKSNRLKEVNKYIYTNVNDMNKDSFCEEKKDNNAFLRNKKNQKEDIDIK